MSKIYPFFMQLLQQIIHLIGYVSLQLILFIFLPFCQGCFVYIGFFLLLPWRKRQVIFQLIIAFILGLWIDTFYNSAGVHAFSTVLLVYCRHFLLHLLPPHTTNQDPHPLGPTLRNMGVKKFSLYVVLLILLYHATVSLLATGSQALFSANLPTLMGYTFIAYGCIVAPMLLPLLVKNL
jgi:hypothetical protein